MFEIKIRDIIKHHSITRLLNEGPRKPQMLGDREIETSQIMATENATNQGSVDEQEEITQVNNKVGNIIPPELYTAFPEINRLQYLKLKDKQSFLMKAVPVCETCFLYFTSLDFKSGSAEVNKLLMLEDDVKLKGTGHLKPEVIKTRYEDTAARIQENEIAKYHRVGLLSKLINTELNIHAKKLEKQALQDSKASTFILGPSTRKLNPLKTTTQSRQIALPNPNQLVKSMLSENNRIWPVYQEFREKTAELIGARSPSLGFSKRAINVTSRVPSNKSKRAISNQHTEVQHRKLKSLSIADKLGLKTFYASCCEEPSTQPTNRSTKEPSGKKSRSSRFKSFSKGISAAQMVGVEGSLFSAKSSIDVMNSKRNKSFRLIDMRQSHRQPLEEQFAMYRSKESAN